MRKLGIYGNTENQVFLLESKFFSDKIKNTRFFSKKASFSDKPLNWSEKPQKNQIFLAEIRNQKSEIFVTNLEIQKNHFFSDSEILRFSSL